MNGTVLSKKCGEAMQNDISEAQNRLKLAQKCEDLSTPHREILCEIIQSEIDDSLSGCYSDIPIQVYHHHLCSGYSSTTIKRMIEQSYNHWFVSKNSKSSVLRFGSAFHAFCNEPHLFENDYFIAPVSDKRSPEYKAAKKFASNKTVITSDEFKTIEIMSRKLFEHPDAAPLLNGAKNELTYFAKDKDTGLWKKCRVDAIKGRSISDLKTTQSASPISFAQDSRKYLYRVSASYYLEVVSEVVGDLYGDFYLIACESTEPNEIAVYRVADASIERSQIEIRQALQLIRTILDGGPKAWKGYSLGIKELSI